MKNYNGVLINQMIRMKNISNKMRSKNKIKIINFVGIDKAKFSKT